MSFAEVSNRTHRSALAPNKENRFNHTNNKPEGRKGLCFYRSGKQDPGKSKALFSFYLLIPLNFMTTKTLSLLCTALTLMACYSCQNKVERSGNPVLQGRYADPEGIIFDDRYWIFPTRSLPFEEQISFDAFSSPDLVEWTKHENILDTTEVKWAKKAMWAPSIIKKEQSYYLFFGANDIYHDGDGGIGVAVASRPEGPYKDLLGRPLIDKIVNGAQPIDQFVFQDKDGSYYLFYGGWGHCNVGRLKDDFTGFIPFEDGELFKEVTPENYVEGPFMFIRNGKYYFMWSEGNWTQNDYCVAYAIADSALGPFRRIGTVLQSDNNIGTGAGHHSVIFDPKGKHCYVVYHRHPLGSTDGNDRVVCIDEMFFDEQGHIMPITITNEGVEKNPLK